MEEGGGSTDDGGFGADPEAAGQIEDDLREYVSQMIAELEQFALRLKEVEALYHLQSARDALLARSPADR